MKPFDRVISLMVTGAFLGVSVIGESRDGSVVKNCSSKELGFNS